MARLMCFSGTRLIAEGLRWGRAGTASFLHVMEWVRSTEKQAKRRHRKHLSFIWTLERLPLVLWRGEMERCREIWSPGGTCIYFGTNDWIRRWMEIGLKDGISCIMSRSIRLLWDGLRGGEKLDSLSWVFLIFFTLWNMHFPQSHKNMHRFFRQECWNG